MQKRGLSNVVASVLIIVIAMIAVVVVWAFIRGFLSEQGEITEVKTSLIARSAEIKKTSFNSTSGNVTILIANGPSSAQVGNTTEIAIAPDNIDLFSVSDMSKSMNCNATGGTDSQSACENLGGVWLGPLNASANANKALIDSVLNIDGNDVGIVGFNLTIRSFHNLSNNAASLKSEIDSWMYSQSPGTCACCGMNRAIQNYNYSSANKRIMILMTDGKILDGSNVECPEQPTTFGALNDSIQAAKDANASGIRVYTLGFGDPTASESLIPIAQAGGGEYFFADADALIETYASIVTQITTTYVSSENSFILVVFYNDNETEQIRINDPPIGPFEAKSYELSPTITNINRIEIYLGVITPSGREVLSDNPLDVWTN